MKYAIPFLFLLLAACSSWTGPPVESRFEQAAESWTGAPLDDMIAAYGPPRTILEDSDVEGAGLAVWRSTGIKHNRNYRCNINAWYDPDRIVTRIDVISSHCDMIYEGELDMLMRRR